MPLNFSAAHSSRITKRPQHKHPLLRRSASSPLTNFNQRKPIKRTLSKPELSNGDGDDDDLFGHRLDDLGLVKSLDTDPNLRDVAQVIKHTCSHMFDVLPENGGFNSTMVAEILNFMKSLPPTVTAAHVHALSESPTMTEREIAELTKAGTTRRIVVPGRGTGGSSIGDGLVLSKDVEALVRQSEELDPSLVEKFLEHLQAKPMAQSFSSRSFLASEVTSLIRAGFLTSTSLYANSANVFVGPASASPGTITSISSISRAASGSMAAVGGEEAIYRAGGRGGIRRSSSQFESPQLLGEGEDLRFSLPGMGPYLKLMIAARSHLVSLLMKSKFQEMPVYLLRERWDGGISADDKAAKAKKYRGEFAGILASRTRKWKDFSGLSFDWILAECLGAGLMELFETGSVGRAVRVV